MTPAEISLAALGAAILLSLTSRINVGLVAIVCAWAVGVGAAGWKADAVMAAFPASLFVTLAGVTLLLAAAEANGTMEAVSKRAIGWCGGHVVRLPLMFFMLAALLSAAGPGAIASTAMVAPVAMSVGVGAGICRSCRP
jgi:di/tricarboxylate transporter